MMQWPADTRESQKEHAYRHVKSADFAIGLCKQKRTAVQAGGNIGLWPLRMAEVFDKVLTFEPEPMTRAVLEENCRASLSAPGASTIMILPVALGREAGRCGIKRRSLGSHNVVEGSECEVIALDSLGLPDVDLLQLDIEGYELHALMGAEQTIRKSRPIIQVELRGFTEKYGHTDTELISFLVSLGYHEVKRLPGSDVVFRG